jgi:hypothetical protein
MPRAEPIIDDVACLPYQGCGWPDSAQSVDLPEAVISTLTSDQDEVASASRHSISAGSAINIPVAFEGTATAAIVVLARDDGVAAMVGRHAPDTAA